MTLDFKKTSPAAADAGDPEDGTIRAGTAWRGYAFSVAVTLATLALRSALSVTFGDRPLLILFVLPVILSAYVGGLGPGLVATAVAAVGVDLAFVPPAGSLRIARGHDLAQWLLLVMNGVLVSTLIGTLRGTKQRMQATARRYDRARADLEFREALLRETGQIAHVGGWEFDAATGRGTWTEEVARIHDMDPSDPTNVERGIGVYVGESRARIEAAVREAVEHGTPYDLELEMTTPAGAHKWVRTIGHPVVENGRVARVRGSFQDITELKRAEAEVRKLTLDLERRVEERTAELRAANRELDAFAYAVSHDLRAPLRALTGFSQALLEDHAGELNGEAQVYLAQITAAARNMGGLVDGLLKLSRTTRGEVHRDAVDLSAAASRILRELTAAEPARRVEWTVEPGLAARGDPRMIEVLLQNLLANAWKYTAKTAAARIEVGRAEGEASESTTPVFPLPPPGSRLPVPVFFVRDNGAGFDMRHASRLFQPFQRLHRQDEFPGIGIGLATVQRIVLRHGGTIEATAAPGQGATFRFTLEPPKPRSPS